MYIILLLFLKFNAFLCAKFLNLSSDNGEWKFCSSNYNQTKICQRAKNVPGDIFTDIEFLNSNGSMLYGNNDQVYKWIGQKSWTYERSFTIKSEIVKVPPNFYL